LRTKYTHTNKYIQRETETEKPDIESERSTHIYTERNGNRDTKLERERVASDMSVRVLSKLKSAIYFHSRPGNRKNNNKSCIFSLQSVQPGLLTLVILDRST